MKLCSTLGEIAALFLALVDAQVIWPNAIDELEDVMFLNTGYKSRGFSSHITPCSYSEFGVGRQTAAEWLRLGFHDMSTTSIYFAPHGGIDASMVFELFDGENIGAGFNTSLITYGNLYNSQLTVSDLIALGVYASVRGCGGPVIPMRGGRVDATKAGSQGVPQPQNSIGTFINQFARMGFNATDMIQMTACGHTLGGVHAGNFPTIVLPGTATNDYQLFDNTFTFDNQIAVRYINGPDTDALAVGPSVAVTRDSDTVVFSYDNNATLKAMNDATVFNNMCSSILQRMIEVVDPSIVTLSPIIQPYEVKPSGLQLTLLSDGASMRFSGDIRVRTTVRSASSISSVQILYKDRTGASGGTLSAAVSGTANGFDDSFTFYGFSVTIPLNTSISSFTVAITTSSSTTTYDNNGTGGFAVQDSVIVQTSQSCFSNGALTVVAAVRSTVTTAVSLGVTQKVPRASPIPVPALSSTSVTLTAGTTLGPYTFYSGSFSSFNTTQGAKYGVSSGTFADAFKDLSALGTSCASSPPSPSASSSSSSPSSTSVSSVTTTSTATASPTLGHEQTIGAYTFQGCYTEATNSRALIDKTYVNYTSMTTEMCYAQCQGFTYWGIEYGRECYCGNVLQAGSVLATLTDCYFVCQGNQYEYCGAGNRLELYMLSLASGSSSLAGGTSATPSASTATTLSTSTSKSIPSTTTSTSTSISPTATAIVPKIGSYTYIGCYTEGTYGRALTGASVYNYTAMTLEMCAQISNSYTPPWTYWGVEYGGECWMGNTWAVGAINTTATDCYFACPANQWEWCGAGNRLSAYMLSS